MSTCSPTPRSIDEGLDWFLSHNASGSGMCAQHTWHSLGGDRGCPPAWSCSDANEVYDKVKKSGRYWTTPKRGDIALWKYGSNGHAARVYDEAGTKIATTNPTGESGGGTGVEPIGYPAKWGATSSARIFTDTYNGILCFTSDSGPHVTEHVYRSKCGFGEPTNGDESSDTVKELQERLNRVSLDGGQKLTVSGIYDADTDEEVRLWQEQIAHDQPDPVMESYLGPNQFALMFPDSIYTLHDDGDPAIASGGSGGGEASSGTTLGQWLKEQGFDVADDDVPFGRDSTWDKVEYVMVHHTGGSGDCTKSDADLAHYCKTGTEYPPICHILLGKTSKVWMTCQQRSGQAEPGRSSHAGEGSGYGIPDDTMNQRCLGIEVQCDGSHPLSTHPEMYQTLIELGASLLIRYDLDADRVIGHKEWSSTGKKDPLDNMDTIRWDIEAELNNPEPEPGPEPPEPEVPPEVPHGFMLARVDLGDSVHDVLWRVASHRETAQPSTDGERVKGRASRRE